ncbi:MAG: ExbD/TolR family protein [Flavobacteriales bacterium]
MAEIIDGGGGGKKKHGGKPKAKKLSTRVDMTPMVDLGFLLLTFFILTTTFNKPQAMEISMPVKDEDIPLEERTKVPAEYTMNLLLSDNDEIYWYMGLIDPSKPMPSLAKTNYSKDGVRKLLIEKNRKIYEQIEAWKRDVENRRMTRDEFEEKKKGLREENKRTSLIVLIKPDKNARYKNIVDALDEMAICNIGSYALLEANEYEVLMIADAESNP